jgi:hypothetical protein
VGDFTSTKAPAKKQLTPGQIKARQLGGKARSKAFDKEYQRTAAQALLDKVSPEYMRFIGRRGGRSNMSKGFAYAAQTYDIRVENPELAAQWSEKAIEAWNEMRRQDFLELAEKYRVETGTRVMLELFDRDGDMPKRRKSKK